MFTLLIVLVVAETIALAILGIAWVHSSRSYHKIAQKADQIAKGNLEVEDIQESSDKAGNAAALAGGFDAIKNNLLTFIEATKGNVITLSDAISVLSSSVDANQAGNEQIAEGVTAVAQQTAEQMELVEQNLELIESSNAQIQEIDEAISEIKSRLDETVQTSEQGIEDIRGYSADMDDVTRDLEGINQILDKFNAELRQIAEVGDIIMGVNSQLTLLAFNASIEAARAGDAGRGFTVVADEMNHMSEETKNGMGTIQKILSEIMESSRMFNESIQKCEAAFGNSKETFGSVSDSLESIGRQSSEIRNQIQAISDKAGRIADNSGELQEQADRLHGATELISDKTHEIAAASEETAAESAQIGDNVETLDQMLGSIQGLLGQFRTSVFPVSKDSKKPLKIAFLSMLDNDFWYAVRRGVFYAQKELASKNIKIDYTPMDYSLDKSVDEQAADKIRECINEHYDGIIFAGFMGGVTPGLKEAIAKGIKVIAYNCDCSPEVKRMAVLSPDGRAAGELAGKSMERALDRRGNIALITGDLKVKINNDRKAGFDSKIAGSKGLRVVGVYEEKNEPDAVYNRTRKCLEEYPDLDAIYITTGLLTSVAKAIEDSGRKGKVITIGFDESPEIFDYISKGIIYATVTQNPFGQGHDPIIWLYNHLVTGESLPSEYIGCRLSVIDRGNVDRLVKA